MYKLVIPAFALLTVIFFASTAKGAEHITCNDAYVIDGDTIACDGRRIRLKNIDSPECTSYPCFDRSSRFLRSQLAGKKTRCTIEYYDKYQRGVGTCSTLTNPDVGRSSVQRGYSREKRYYRQRY